MTVSEPMPPEVARPGDPSEGGHVHDDGPALRDARSIDARVAVDQAAAEVAGPHYRLEGLPSLDADAHFAELRQPEERLHAIYSGALLEITRNDGTPALLLLGTLYLTSRRLLHAGAELFEMLLSAIHDPVVSLERVLLMRLADGSDLALEVESPQLLHAQITAAQAAETAAAKA